MAVIYEQTVPATAENVATLRAGLRDALRSEGIDTAVEHDICLAVTEAATNVVLHAYRGEPEPLEVVAERGEELSVFVRDSGRGMAPRLDSAGLGIGLSLMGALSSAMVVAGREDGPGTEIRLHFALDGQGPAAPAPA